MGRGEGGDGTFLDFLKTCHTCLPFAAEQSAQGRPAGTIPRGGRGRQHLRGVGLLAFGFRRAWGMRRSATIVFAARGGSRFDLWVALSLFLASSLASPAAPLQNGVRQCQRRHAKALLWRLRLLRQRPSELLLQCLLQEGVRGGRIQEAHRAPRYREACGVGCVPPSHSHTFSSPSPRARRTAACNVEETLVVAVRWGRVQHLTPRRPCSPPEG